MESEHIGETSMTMPPVEEHPVKQWPPLRIAMSRWWRRACAIVAETSLGSMPAHDRARSLHDDPPEEPVVVPSDRRRARRGVVARTGQNDLASNRRLKLRGLR